MRVVTAADQEGVRLGEAKYATLVRSFQNSEVDLHYCQVQSPTSKVQSPFGESDIGLWTLDFGHFVIV